MGRKWDGTQPRISPHRSELLVGRIQAQWNYQYRPEGDLGHLKSEPQRSSTGRGEVTSFFTLPSWFSAGHHDRHFPSAKVQTVRDRNEGETISYTTTMFLHQALYLVLRIKSLVINSRLTISVQSSAVLSSTSDMKNSLSFITLCGLIPRDISDQITMSFVEPAQETFDS